MINITTQLDQRATLFPRTTVFFDLETTGVDAATDKIVQIAAVKFNPATQTATYLNQLINPGRPIPVGASEVHKIVDADVLNMPMFNQICTEIMDYFGDADLGGYNILQYDIPCLMQHFYTAGIGWTYEGRKIYDAFAVFSKMFSRNLTSALKYYCNKEMSDLGGNAHDAFTDTLASMEVFLGQLAKYDKTPDDLHHLVMDGRLDLEGKLCRNMEGAICLSFGKYKNTPVQEVAAKDAGYIYWVNGTLSADSRQKLNLAIKGLLK